MHQLLIEGCNIQSMRALNTLIVISFAAILIKRGFINIISSRPSSELDD